MTPVTESERRRCAVFVEGVVQGVGFRPYLYRLATRHVLAGWVRNGAGKVAIEIEGAPDRITAFLRQIAAGAPASATITNLRSEPRAPLGESEFRILPSYADDSARAFAADLASCDDCVAEIFAAGARRHRYPFTSCAACGPRLTLITGAPYDRARTTMAAFALCEDCRAEYEDPADRRFHAQPIACPRCGPRLQFLDGDGAPLASPDPIEDAARALASGSIVAIKGLGGYHLACDARDQDAVAELRRRKQRDAKPLAVMVRDLAAARALCEISDGERALLESAARPIVLLRRRQAAAIAPAIAPDHPLLGVMLPYAPLHHLLLAQFGAPLVMTSGNLSDEPIAFEDGDARARLGGLCHRFLVHDRAIHLRCDDSVARLVDGAPLLLRRARGFAPLPIVLPLPLSRPTLAVGGQQKGAFALGDGARAMLSQHLGDLDHLAAHRAFCDGIAHYARLFDFRAQTIAHDLHPDYASTRWAREQAGVNFVAVQHHHAHLAACLADNGEPGPAIGVCFDGSGYGSDGAVWGGEFLVGDAREFIRAAQLAYVPLPGGERAIREPWRMAVSHLCAASIDPAPYFSHLPQLAGVIELARKKLSPPTSSVGRLFDAVAALLGVCSHARFEAEGPMRLEALAAREAPSGEYPFELRGGEIDVRPTLAALLDDRRHPARAARRFHSTVVAIVAAACAQIRDQHQLSTVALSGGVFCNALIAAETRARLQRDGFRVLVHRQVPPNDGGLALGQLLVAAAREAA